jgi:GTP-binding protein
LADVGIVGLPNAGKSTLLSVASHAHPKIADYPFTTLEPSLGVVSVGYTSFVLADIPGLIEGAHTGAGLGHQFLRHVERTRLLVQLIDGSRDDPLHDMDVIDSELEQFSPELRQKPQLVAINKVDMPEVKERLGELKALFATRDIEPIFISAATGEGVADLMQTVAANLPQPQVQEAVTPVIQPRPVDEAFKVTKRNGVYSVAGDRPVTLAEMMPLDDEEAQTEFWRRLTRMGVSRALRRSGAKPGDRVRFGKVEVEWPG